MEISLFQKKIGRQNKKQKLKFLLTRSLLFWVMFMSICMIIVAGWSLVINRQNAKLDQQLKSTKQKIGQYQKVESQQVYLTSKLKSFKGLIKTQEVHQDVTETVFSLLPSGTELKGFKVEPSGIIKLSGTVPDYLILSELLDRIKDKENHKLKIDSAMVNKIMVTKEGSVNFDIDLQVRV
jgi:Tfp pilus assembly protein PilN